MAPCRELGAGAAVVLGHPGYYPRFGFSPASRFGVGSEYDVPDEAFMLIELVPGCLEGATSGEIRQGVRERRRGEMMKTTIVRYKVKADQAEENKAFIRGVFEELEDSKPEDLRYVSFNLEDGQSFVHIAVVETEDGSNPLPEAAAFRKFVADLKDRCEEPPVATSAEIVGSYRLFWQRAMAGD